MLTGLAPAVGDNPTLLVLGSMPSEASLRAQRYYAHPRNAFWPLMAELLGFELQPAYTDNLTELTQRGVAIWDVIAQCERPGSLDSAIVAGSERFNPVPGFLDTHPAIDRILLNGGTAARLFKRHCLPDLEPSRFQVFALPSTSPANARMNFAAKCEAWRQAVTGR